MWFLTRHLYYYTNVVATRLSPSRSEYFCNLVNVSHERLNGGAIRLVHFRGNTVPRVIEQTFEG